MTNDSSMESHAATTRWWISTAGKAEGPFPQGHVIDAVNAGEIPITAHACPVGGTQWKRLGQWPPFAEMVPPAPEVIPPPPNPPTSLPNDSPLTNPRLPAIANWICIYAILVSPVIWAIGYLSFCVTGPTYHPDSRFVGFEILLGMADFFASLVAMVFKMIGGLRLQNLRSSGAKILKWTMLAYLAFVMLQLLIIIPIAVVSSESDYAETTPAGEIIFFFMFVIALGALAFEIFAIVWLHQNANRLPLDKN